MQNNQAKAMPQQKNAYKVCINKRYGDLESDYARLQVSVGNPRYEGAKLQALADFCRRRYIHTTIVLSDTLQRHNKPDPARYWMACRREGQEWLERNREYLQGFTIVRWDNYLIDERYVKARQAIDQRTAQGEAYQALMAMAANHHHAAPLEQCVEFLREELAVFSFMMEEKAIDVYAGSWITSLLQSIDLPVFSHIRCLSVDLERKKIQSLPKMQAA